MSTVVSPSRPNVWLETYYSAEVELSDGAVCFNSAYSSGDYLKPFRHGLSCLLKMLAVITPPLPERPAARLNLHIKKRPSGRDSDGAGEAVLAGSPAQVEWAERIKCRVGEEFAGVASAFRAVAQRQSGETRVDTEIILAILEEKRAEVMDRREASYFIRVWQEISDQVRKIISGDPRFQAIQAKRLAVHTQRVLTETSK